MAVLIIISKTHTIEQFDDTTQSIQESIYNLQRQYIGEDVHVTTPPLATRRTGGQVDLKSQTTNATDPLENHPSLLERIRVPKLHTNHIVLCGVSSIVLFDTSIIFHQLSLQ
jgi:hypothetical protein